MKSRLLLITLAVCALATAAQDGFKLVRAYKQGDKDTLETTIKINSQMGAMEMSMVSTETVKKVYDNGDADVETQVTSTKMNMMGQTREMPSSPATTQRFNKNGVPIPSKDQKASRGGMNISFVSYSRILGEGELKLNEPFAIDWTDPNDPKSKAKGTVTLIELTGTTAVMKSDMNVWTAESGNDPIHMVMTATIDRSSGKTNKASGKVDKIPATLTQGFQIDSMEITINRKV
jgi:hypothetical protein